MEARDFASAALAAVPTLCLTTLFPPSGVMTIGPGGTPVPLTDPVVYQVPCATAIVPRDVPYLGIRTDSSLTQHEASESNPKISNFRDPFYASTFPVCYALAATTVTAYMLVIMLFITPRSFLDGGVVYLGRRNGFTHSSSSSVSIGGRPWLQKVAALTVAISLTVASADTFKVAQNQYTWGIQNAKLLQDEVMGGTEIKVIRIVSDTFLWLAQAQTLIRLFPRQREKVIIKWVAFALITLDVVFSALNSFKYSDNGINANVRPKNFVHPVPALSYLFQLSLGLLYAAWVIYYALTKKRYAFFHPLMRNMPLVAVISVLSIVVPVVFFILDISKPEFTGWGDYVRWVGAAAASVIVWEWVERIEALEREEKKDGILGREVFDGDDMLEVNAADFAWIRNRKNRKSGGGSPGSSSGGERQQASSTANGWPNVSAITNRYRGQGNNEPQATNEPAQRTMGEILRPSWPARPAPAITPVSRTDTPSAASTVYAVRYQPPSEATTRTPDILPQHSVVDLPIQGSPVQTFHGNDDPMSPSQAPTSAPNRHATATPARQTDIEANTTSQDRSGWRTLTYANPLFRRSTEEPPTEVTQSTQIQQPEPQRVREETSRWDFRARLEDFGARHAEKLRDRIRPAPNMESLPTTVIPAPPRRGAALQQVLEEEEMNNPESTLGGRTIPNQHSNSNSSTSRDASDELAHLERSRSTLAGSQHGELPIPPNNPPLWRGVQPRMMYEDEYSYDGDSASETSSIHQNRQGSDSSGQRASR